MRVSCPKCSTTFEVNEAKIPPTGAKLKCSKCQTLFPISVSQPQVTLGNSAPRPPTAPRPAAKAPVPPGPAGGGAIPLPGSLGDDPFGDSIPLPGSGAASDAIALPGAAGGDDPFAADFGESATSASPAAAEDPFGFDPGGSGGDSVPLPGNGGGGSDDPFGELPGEAAPAPAAAAGGDPFGFDLPAEEAPAPADDPFAELGQAVGGGRGPAPVPPDLGDPFAASFDEPSAAPAASASPGDDMEFDPTAPPPAGPPPDEFEADLNARAPAPMPEAAPTGDDLELLDFIDDAAAAAGNKGRPRARKTQSDGFQIRNRQNKTFGPMPEAEVVKMLGDGRLLGNEEITQDGENWVALGAHPAFAEALARLMEAPGTLPGADSPSALDAAPAPTVDPNARLKQLYGDRMAQMTIVDSRASRDRIKKYLPVIAAGGAGLALLLGGLSMGFTSYGVFGFKKLFPTVIKEGSPLYQKLVDARAAYDRGTFASLKTAQAGADEVLKENDGFRNARAVFALTTYALKERYGIAGAEALARADQYVDQEWELGKESPEIVEARAYQKRLQGQAEAVQAELEAMVAAKPDAPGLQLALARMYVEQKNDGAAQTAFGKAEESTAGQVRAFELHARSLLAKRDNVGAAALLEKALKVDPKDGPSALELGRLRIGPLAEPERAEEVVKPLLDSDQLSEEEKARAHALIGMIRVYQKKQTEAEAEFAEAQKLAPESGAVKGAYASYLLKRRDFEPAVPLFEKAFAERPDDIDLLDGLIRAQVGSGKIANTQKPLAAADGKLARVSLLKGLVAEASDKPADAETAYKQAVERDPKLVAADLALTEFYVRRRRFLEGRTSLEVALKKAPQNPQLLALHGQIALAELRVADAKASFESAIKVDADTAAAHMGLAEVMLSEKDVAGARREAELALKQDDKLPGAHRVLANVSFAEKKFDEARKTYETALRQDPRDEAAQIGVGQSNYEMGKYDDAQRALENALTLNKTNPETHFFKALSHYKKNESTQAIDEMLKVMDQSSSATVQRKAVYRYHFGLIYRAAEGHFTEAVEEFKTAIKLQPDYADALEAMGDALIDGSVKESTEFYEKAFAADPNRHALLGKVGEALMKDGQWARAVDAFQRLLKADEKATFAYFKIGRCYDELGKRDLAITSYKEATVKDKENALSWYHLGYAYKERNKAKDAVAAFNEYLRLAPKGEDRVEVEREIEGLRMDK